MSTWALYIWAMFFCVNVYILVLVYPRFKKKFARYEVGSWIGTTDGVLNWVNKSNHLFWTKSNALRCVGAYTVSGDLTKEVRDLSDYRYDRELIRKHKEALAKEYRRGYDEAAQTVIHGRLVEWSSTLDHHEGVEFIDMRFVKPLRENV